MKKRNQNGRLLKGRRLLNQKQSLQAATRQESIMADQTKTQNLFYIADYFGNNPPKECSLEETRAFIRNWIME